jgi:Mrp family chromosome partitioning ATPase
MRIINVIPIEHEQINKYIKQLNDIQVLNDYIYYDQGSLEDMINTNPDIIVVSEFIPEDRHMTLYEFIYNLKLHTSARIIFLCGGRGVGDKLLHNVVNIGVYDIIDEPTLSLDKISQLIATPNQYKDVARYHNPGMETAALEVWNMFERVKSAAIPKKVERVIEERVIEKEIIKEVPKEVVRQIIQPGLKETIVFWSNKETGKTFVSTNYAVVLAQQPHKPKVLLIEGDYQNNALWMEFNVPMNHTGMAEVNSCNNTKQIFKLMHRVDGLTNLYILAHHPNLKNTKFDASTLQHIQDYLRQDIDYVIIDAGRNHEDPFIRGALKVATKVYVVTTLDWHKNFHLNNAIQELQSSRLNLEKYRLVVNQAVNGTITPRELESLHKIPLAGVIPFEVSHYSEIMNGHFRRSPLMLQQLPDIENTKQAILNLINNDIYQPTNSEHSKSLLGNLRVKFNSLL